MGWTDCLGWLEKSTGSRGQHVAMNTFIERASMFDEGVFRFEEAEKHISAIASIVAWNPAILLVLEYPVLGSFAPFLALYLLL